MTVRNENGAFKETPISEAVNRSLEITALCFKTMTTLEIQEKIDVADDNRREEARKELRPLLQELKEEVKKISNEKIIKLLNNFEERYEYYNDLEDYYEKLDDMSREKNICVSEKAIDESRTQNRALESIHLESSKKDKRAAAGTTTLKNNRIEQDGLN